MQGISCHPKGWPEDTPFAVSNQRLRVIPLSDLFFFHAELTRLIVAGNRP